MQHNDLCAYAGDIAARLSRMIDGDPTTPRAWIWLNAEHGIPVTAYYKANGRRGCFTVDHLGRGQICYNTAYPVSVQVRVLIHESAHALIAADDPFPEIDFVAHYDELLPDERHEICRRVEFLLLRDSYDR